MNKKIIAIDGVSASGKGTLGRALAAHYGFDYLDTGKIYRALAWAMHQGHIAPNDSNGAVHIIKNFDFSWLSNPNLTTEEIGKFASIIASDGVIRAALLQTQRDFAHNAPVGAVLDGRDIGTVICPDAVIKIYVICDAKIRAHRRYLELQSIDNNVNEEAILHDINGRDERDMNRAIAPLKPCEDSYILDTSLLSIEQCVNQALVYIGQMQPRW